MFRTIEMRWFWPAREIDATESWFAGDGRLPAPERRTDSYLVMPGCAATGVKIREGGLEIKALAGEERHCTVAGLEGIFGEWVKWRCIHPSFAAISADIDPSGHWLQVGKRRVQRLFTRTGATVMEVPPERPVPETGCNVELTGITLGPNRPAWLTFNLEVFGPGPDRAELLKDVAGDFIRSHGMPPGVVLSSANAFSYPGWLNRIASEKLMADY